MRSRWTDFLTTDGEKPDRNRDMEFVITQGTTRDDVLEQWEGGWDCLFAALEPLTPVDFSRKVLIRGEEHSVTKAISRQLAHYASHIGQIVFLSKHFRSREWKSLSIPRNRSAEIHLNLSEKTAQGDERQTRFDAPETFTKEKGKKD